MHIETRRQQKRKKYYLAHSYRENGKAKKIRVYLGADLSKRQLDAAMENGKRELERRILTSKTTRDPYETVLSEAEVKELETLQPTGEIKLLHLSEAEWIKFTGAFTYNTNAIEGSAVTEEEVIDILEKNKWPQRTKEEISETYGLAEAVKYVRKTKEHASLELIKKLHEIVFKNSKSFAGKFRQNGEEVVVGDRFGNIVHRGAPSTQVPYLLKKLVKWYSKNKKLYAPLVLAAVVHNQFENIHPFRDGNGRVGRLLLINVLLRHGLPPLNIELENRFEYYASLQEYERNNNLRPTLELMLKEYKKLKKMLKK